MATPTQLHNLKVLASKYGHKQTLIMLAQHKHFSHRKATNYINWLHYELHKNDRPHGPLHA